MPTINFADEHFTGPNTFAAAGPTQPIIETVAGAAVTITGGVILGSPTAEVVADPVLYGTASNFGNVNPDPSLQQSLTISLSTATTNFAVEIFNGLPTSATYQVTDNAGDSTTITLPPNTSSSSAATVNIANTHGATVFTITPVGGGPWDYFIDNVVFNYSSTETAIPGDISINTLHALPDIVITMSELAVLLAPSAASTLFFSLQIGVLVAWALSLDTQAQANTFSPSSSAASAASTVTFDPNYKQQYTPTFFQFSSIQSDSTITSHTAADANIALSDLSKAIGFMQALEVTLNRLSSAMQQNDQASIALQSSELDSFLTSSSASLAAVAKDLNTLATDFTGASLPTLTAQQIAGFVNNVTTHGLSGLPQQEQALLSSLGVSSTDEQTIISSIASANPSIVPSSLVNALEQTSTPLQSVANVLSGYLTGSNPTNDAVAELYIGYYGRAGDPQGWNFWTGAINSGLTIQASAASFSVQVESQAQYPFLANPSTASPAQIAAFIGSIYSDLFNRSPDSTGLMFWQGYLTQNLGNPQAVGSFILDVIDGATNTSAGQDLTTILNKVAGAEFLTQAFTAAGINFNASVSTANLFAHSNIAGITSTAASLSAAEAAVTAFVSAQSASSLHAIEVTGVSGASLVVNDGHL